MNIRKSKKQECTMKPTIGIANTDFGLIEKCSEILKTFGVGHFVYQCYRKRYGNNKDQKALMVIGLKRASRFIEVFGAFLRKQAQIGLVKKFVDYRLSVDRCTLYGNIENSIYTEIKRLNQKGILRDYTPNTSNGVMI